MAPCVRAEASVMQDRGDQIAPDRAHTPGGKLFVKTTTHLITSFICFALGCASVEGAVSYWDANGTAPGAAPALGQAPGTWGVDPYWNLSPDGTGTPDPWTSGNTAVFSAGTDATNAFDVTLSTTQYAAGLTFEEGQVSLQGAPVMLTGAGGQIYVGPDTTTETLGIIESVIGGTNGLTKTGSGTLVLTSTNAPTYTSPDGTTNTIINEGALSLGDGCTNCGFLQDNGAGGHHIINNGVLIYNHVLTGPLFVENFSGVISGTGSFVKQGRLRLQLTSLYTNTFSGDIIVEGGRLSAGGNPGCAIPNGPGKGNVYLNIHTEFDVDGNDLQINGLSGPGDLTNSVPLRTNYLSVGGNDQSSVFRGIVPEGSNAKSNHIILHKVGAGTLTVTGNDISTDGNNSAWVRPVVVDGGTLLGDNQTFSGAVGNCDVIVNSGATLGGWGRFKNPATINAGGTLSPGSGGIGLLTFNSTLTLYGNLRIEVDKLFPARNESLSLSNDTVEVDGTLVNSGSGTVTVVNLGPALKAGDTFYLFKDSSYNNKALANGQNMTVVSAGGGVVWANNLAVNGSIAVVSATAPPAPNTNLTIAAAGPGSFKLLGAGAAGSAYNLFAFTNLTAPQSNWWVLGTTNADDTGLVQFLDSQATNARRFYRIWPAAITNYTPPSGMVLIPAGSFTMGNSMDPNEGNSDELPLHTVYVSAFDMDRCEVSKALWNSVYTWATAHGYSFDDAGTGKFTNHPIHTVNWYDCVKWCNARSEQEGLVPAYYTNAAQTAVYRTGDNDLLTNYVKWSAGYRLPDGGGMGEGGAGRRRWAAVPVGQHGFLDPGQLLRLYDTELHL